MCFNISIKKNPEGIWDLSQGDHRLNFNFGGKDFDELNNLLNVKLAPTKKSDSEDYVDYNERLKRRYIKVATEKGYKMLGRFSDCYENVIFLSSETEELLEECLKLKEKTKNSDAIIALDKLIKTCNEALKTNSGIFFGSD